MKVIRVSKASDSLYGLRELVEAITTTALIRKRGHHFFAYRTLDPLYDIVQKNYACGEPDDLASEGIPTNAFGVAGLVSDLDPALFYVVDYSGAKPKLVQYVSSLS